MKIVVTGGSGLIGTALIKELIERKDDVILFTRNPENSRKIFPKGITPIVWDGKTIGAWTQALGGCDIIINFSGESIGAKRWTANQKRKIMESRIDSARVLIMAIQSMQKKPATLINASAIGIYGDVPEDEATESYPAGSDFLAEVCKRWEAEPTKAKTFGTRVVNVRTGIVLALNGGALARMLLPFKLFLGGPLGSGRQWFPWIHLQDLIKAILFIIDHPSIEGPVNMAAPDYVRMKDFCNALGKAMHRPSFAPVPAFVLKVALGEMSTLVLTGVKVIPQKLLDHHFQFDFPKLETALENLFERSE